MKKRRGKEIYSFSDNIVTNYSTPLTLAWDYGRKHALPLWMEFVGFSNWEKGSKYIHCCPNNTAIELPLKGNMSITSGGKTRLVNSGEMIILPAGQENQLTTGPAGFCRKLSCGLCGSMVDQLLTNLHFSSENILPIGDPEAYTEFFKKNWADVTEKNKNDIAQITGMTLEFLVQISINHTSTKDPLFAEAIRIIEFTISRNIKITEIASELGISTQKLNNLFKQETGISPKQYVINRRMEKAENFLKNSNKNIKGIAFLTGYSSPQKFCNDFVKRHGVSPREFRNLNRV